MENIPQAVLIGIELLRPGKNFFPDIQGAEFEEMVEDIREHGIHDPLSVVRNDDGTFTIISGQQRYRAAKKAELKVVPCYIDEGDPIAAIISTNFYRRHFTKEERELYKAKKKMMEEEIIREDILPKLIPDLIEQYEKGKLTLNQAARIACRIPKTLQKALLKDRIATVVEDSPKGETNVVVSNQTPPIDLIFEEKIEAFEKEIESLKKQLKDSQARVGNVNDILFRKEKEWAQSRKKSLDEKEKLLDEIDRLVGEIQKADERAKKQYEQELDERRQQLEDLSKKDRARDNEEESLREKLRSEKNRVLTLDSELKAQKILRAEIEQSHKSELEKYARPDLLIKKLNHLADESEATDQHLDSFVTTYSVEQRTEMAKAVHRLFQSVERMKKKLSTAEQAMRPSTTERAQLLPFQKARQSGNASL